jgi:hypothetical protein
MSTVVTAALTAALQAKDSFSPDRRALQHLEDACSTAQKLAGAAAILSLSRHRDAPMRTMAKA